MSDIKLNTLTGDLDLTTGTILIVTDVDAIAQRLRIRLRFFLGEWFLDKRQGVPYFQKILGQKRRKSLIDQLFRKIILGTPGVALVTAFTQSFDSVRRELQISFEAQSTTGETISVNELFIVG